MSNEPREIEIDGHSILVDDQQGHLMVSHDGTLSFDELFAIKSVVWGDEARAIEVYPAKSQLVNRGNYRHLWRLGPADFAPDLLGRDGHYDSLKSRTAIAWAEARHYTPDPGS